jgi:hypothetical protein
VRQSLIIRLIIVLTLRFRPSGRVLENNPLGSILPLNHRNPLGPRGKIAPLLNRADSPNIEAEFWLSLETGSCSKTEAVLCSNRVKTSTRPGITKFVTR